MAADPSARKLLFMLLIPGVPARRVAPLWMPCARISLSYRFALEFMLLTQNMIMKHTHTHIHTNIYVYAYNRYGERSAYAAPFETIPSSLATAPKST